MSPEPAECVVARAFEAIEHGGGVEAEVLVRRSRGCAVRIARGTPPESSSWSEDAMAVLATLKDGRCGLATESGLSWPEETARRALRLAEESGAQAPTPPHRLREFPDALGDPPRDPPSHGALADALALVEGSALATDERIVALDAAQARTAIVESYLAATSGTAAWQRQVASLAHASFVARDGLRSATRGEAWAGPLLSPSESRRFGERCGRSALIHLCGSGAAPPSPRRLLLSPGALADITFGLGLALLGVVRCDAEAPRVDPRLSLTEDAAGDLVSRVLPIDGAGRLLRPVPIVANLGWRRPRPAEIPWIRPGLGDLSRPAWMRLTWRWEGGESEEALVARMATGLFVESVHSAGVDARHGAWSGSASGWWVEDGRRRHAVAGVPLTVTIAQILMGATAGGAEPVLAHSSGAVRAIHLLVDLERAAS